MNQSNDPTLTKNLTAIKYSKYYLHHKCSQETDYKRKCFDNFESFAKQAVPIPQKVKNVGKIRRNSTTSINEPSQKQKIGNQNAKPECAIDKWINDELISKIRCSQMVNQPQKVPTSILQQCNQNNITQKSISKRNTRSVSSHYETQYTNMVKEYQKKKQKINHEIESLRRTEQIKVEKFYQTSAYNPTHSNQTPKFGNYVSLSQKKISTKPTLKVNKDPKCLQFLKSIKTQIELEQKLRNLKHQITKDSKQKIKSMLKSQYGIDEDITIIDSEQFDPFIQIKQSNIETLTSQLANSYLSVNQNWNKNIKNNFDQTLLNDVFNALESGEKGLISLKGFVREMGVLLQNEKYLRNRDLYRIYKRIQPFHRQNFLASLKKNK